MNFGEALAQGLMQGAGDALNAHAQLMRRKQMQQFQVDTMFNNFQKQAVYSSRMKQVEAQNVTAEQWKAQAGKSVNQIIDENAAKAARGLPAADVPMFIRDYKKRQNGISKSEALANGGYVLPDYSEFINDPTLSDAIPKANLPGSTQGMDEIYKYDPSSAYAQGKQDKLSATVKMTDGQRKYQRSLENTRNLLAPIAHNMNATVSDSTAQYVLGRVKNTNDVVLPDGTTYNPAQAVLKRGMEDGSLVKSMNPETEEMEIVPLAVAMQRDKDADASHGYTAQQAASDVAKATAPTSTLAPVAEKYKTEQTAKEKAQNAKEATQLGTKAAKSYSSFKGLNQLDTATSNLSPEAKAIVFNETTWAGLTSLSDNIRKLRAATGDPASIEAANYLAKVANISATLKHDQFGASQTALETKNFDDQLLGRGFFSSPEVFQQQLNARRQLVVNDIDSQYSARSPEVQEIFMKRHDDLTPFLTRATDETGKPTQAPQATVKEDDKLVTSFRTPKPEGVNQSDWAYVIKKGKEGGYSDDQIDMVLKQQFPQLAQQEAPETTSGDTKALQSSVQEKLNIIDDDKTRSEVQAALASGQLKPEQLDDFIQRYKASLSQ